MLCTENEEYFSFRNVRNTSQTPVGDLVDSSIHKQNITNADI